MKPSKVLESLVIAIRNKHRILLTGAPGIGKTELVKEASSLVKAHLVLCHPVICDPTDFKGMPWIVEVDGKVLAKFIPFGELLQLEEAKELTVFCLDDLGPAGATIQAAAMQLVLGGQLNEVKLSEHVVPIACTNRKQDLAAVTGIIEPLKSRFHSILEVHVDVEDWAAWAIRHKLPFDVIAYVRWKPDMLFDFKPTRDMTNSPCPRTVFHACQILMGGYPPECEMEMIQGAVGEAWMIGWKAFKEFRDRLPSVDIILSNPAKGEIPVEPHIMYSLCGALAERADRHTFGNIVTYANRLSKTDIDKSMRKIHGRPEFSILLIKDCLIKDNGLRKHPAYVDWQLNHKEVII